MLKETVTRYGLRKIGSRLYSVALTSVVIAMVPVSIAHAQDLESDNEATTITTEAADPLEESKLTDSLDTNKFERPDEPAAKHSTPQPDQSDQKPSQPGSKGPQKPDQSDQKPGQSGSKDQQPDQSGQKPAKPGTNNKSQSHSQSTSQDRTLGLKPELPTTGEISHQLVNGLAMISILSGVGFLRRQKKNG